MRKTLLLAMLAASTLCHAQNLTSVPVDEAKLRGAWYEIARYPFKPQRNCISDATELIARGDKPHALSWVDACRTKDGYTQIRNLVAKPDKRDPGKFTVTRLFVFRRHYIFLSVDPEYRWTLIGSPDHKNLWILSRTPTLNAETYDAITATAASKGYPDSHLVRTRQTPLADSANVPATAKDASSSAATVTPAKS